jgi:hypothetical protein
MMATWRNSPYHAMVSSLSRIHDHTQTHAHSVGLLWTGYQPDPETSTWQQTILKTDIHAIGEIRTRNRSKRPQTLSLDRAATEIGAAFRMIINKEI